MLSAAVVVIRRLEMPPIFFVCASSISRLAVGLARVGLTSAT